METIIHDATIIAGDASETVHYRAAIVVADDRIAAVGPSAELLERHPAATRIDGRGKAVFPGFANLHTHFILTIARGIFEDMSPPHRPPFEGGLARVPMPPLTEEEVRAMTQLGALEAIRSGTTAVLEDGHHIATYADLMEESGLRLLLCERVWDRAGANIGQPGPFRSDAKVAEDGLRHFEALHKAWNGRAGGRIRVGLAAWAPDMCSPELLRDLAAETRRRDVVSTIHLNQIWGEVEAVKGQRGGKLPTEYLADTGFLTDRLVAAHCRCMTAGEERILGEAHATVSFNSAIAARRGLSPRIDILEKAGCRIALGTDNMSEDMVEVVRTGMFMERVRREDGRNPTPEAALAWGTRNGYQALEVPDGGVLEPGNKADLIVVDLRRAHLAPVLRVVSTFVHQGQARDVESVMVDGRWLMKDGKVLVMDEDAVVERAGQAACAAWRRLFEQRPDLEPVPGMHLG